MFVYRFTKECGGQTLAPRYMAGTLEAIAELGATPLMDSAIEVQAKLLDGGFYYQHTPSGALLNIDLPPPRDK